MTSLCFTHLRLEEFKPNSELVLPQNPVDHPRFPVIDAHNHLGDEFGGGWHHRPVQQLLDVLDASGIERLVDLDGGWGEQLLLDHLAKFKEAAPDRFACFAGVDWTAWSRLGNHFPEWAAERLAAQVRWGAQGLKIWKPFGLDVSDELGHRVAVDDVRLDPIWQTAAEIDVPVLIHVADPAAFFRPLDCHNERYELLRQHPQWHLARQDVSLATILDEFARLIARHRFTVFIGAHVGCYAENLAWVGALLDRCPNFYVDLAARIDELARQPYTARRFILRYQDRVLFGTDLPPDVAMYRTHYRFLETDDEHFPGPGDCRPGVSWPLIGLYLPPEVLVKVYRANALRLLKVQPAQQR